MNALTNNGNLKRKEYEKNEKNDLNDENEVDNQVIQYFKNERNKLAQTLNENFLKEKNTVNKINIPKSPRFNNQTKYITRNTFSSKNFSPNKTYILLI